MGDNDFPTVMANGGQFLAGYTKRKGLLEEQGSDIPGGSVRYEMEQQLGGPVTGEVEVSGSPSFEIPGGRSKYRFPTLPGENPEDVPMRFTYPVQGPKLPLAANPFGISDDEMSRRKALRDIIDKPGYDPNTVREAQKQWIKLMQQTQVRGV